MKERARTIMASLPFELPKSLLGEVYAYVQHCINLVPSNSRGGMVPYTTFHGTRPDYQSWTVPFGRVAQFKSITDTNINSRAVYGITLGPKPMVANTVKGYIPSTNHVVMRHLKNVHILPTNVPPSEWKWKTQIAAPAYSNAHHDNSASNKNPDDATTHPNKVSSSGHVNESDLMLKKPEEVDDTPNLIDYDSDDEDEQSIDDQPQPKLPAEEWKRHQAALHKKIDIDIQAYPITYEEALKGDHADDADTAVDEELDNMERYKVWSPITFNSMTADEAANVIPSGLYLRYKTDPASGVYIKSKARLHAGGHRQQPNSYGETASHMINMFIVFIMLKVMSACNWCHAVFDIKGAFLHARRVHPTAQYMRLSRALTNQWLRRHPDHASFVHTDNCLYVRLDKALYGLKDSGYAWFVHLDEYLHSIGFVTSSSDRCMYIMRKSATNFVYVLTHVDDLLVVGLGECFTSFPDTLRKTFPDFTHQTSDTFTYLGMSVKRDRTNNAIMINQSAYIAAMVKEYGLSDCTPVRTPCASDFLDTNPDNTEECDKNYFLSIIMSLMYLARMTRPDILFPVTFLATKSAHPTIRNLAQAKRILRYVKGNMSLSLTLSGTSLNLCLYADASHGIYADGKGHYGVVMMMGGDEVFRICRRIKCVTLSSTESEIVALVDAATYIRWLIALYKELGLDIEVPVTLHQDNQSAIHIVTNGPTFKRTKHMTIKTHFAKGLIDEGLLKLQFTPSEEMNADNYSKNMNETRIVRYTARIFQSA